LSKEADGTDHHAGSDCISVALSTLGLCGLSYREAKGGDLKSVKAEWFLR
jgi:hypothetical protein